MAPGIIVGRRVIRGWQENGRSKKTFREEGDDVSDGEERLKTSVSETALPLEKSNKNLEESVQFAPTQGGRFGLDRVQALKIIRAKMRTFTESNKRRYEGFAEELERLIKEEPHDTCPEFTITGTGLVPGNSQMGRFIRIERKGKKHVLPRGFRLLCRSAIQRKFNPRSNEFLFVGKKSKRERKDVHD